MEGRQSHGVLGRNSPRGPAQRTETLLRIEPEFHRLPGLARGRLPPPPANRILSGLNQHGMSSFYLDGLNRAIRLDQRLNFHAAAQVQITRHLWIGGNNSADYFAAFRLILLLSGGKSLG